MRLLPSSPATRLLPSARRHHCGGYILRRPRQLGSHHGGEPLGGRRPLAGCGGAYFAAASPAACSLAAPPSPKGSHPCTSSRPPPPYVSPHRSATTRQSPSSPRANVRGAHAHLACVQGPFTDTLASACPVRLPRAPRALPGCLIRRALLVQRPDQPLFPPLLNPQTLAPTTWRMTLLS